MRFQSVLSATISRFADMSRSSSRRSAKRVNAVHAGADSVWAPRISALMMVVFVGGLVLGPTMACNRVTEQTEAQRQKLAEQERILAYSKGVATVDLLQASFTDAWKTANEQTNIKDLKEAFDSRVLPALDGYLKALNAMPTESDKLRRIHAILAGAYAEMATVFKDFSKDLTEDNIITRHKALLDSTDKVHAAQRKYYGELKAYYKAHNVTLTEASVPKPKAGSPAPPTLKKPAVEQPATPPKSPADSPKPEDDAKQ